jgi:rubredoxin
MLNLKPVLRDCKFCTRGVSDKVPVIPRYTWEVRVEEHCLQGTSTNYMDVVETWLCPCCGEKNTKVYSFDHIPKDILQAMVERTVN